MSMSLRTANGFRHAVVSDVDGAPAFGKKEWANTFVSITSSLIPMPALVHFNSSNGALMFAPH